jgi:electron transport complex protein RnfD
MAKRIMLVPSKRFRFVDYKSIKFIEKMLIIVSVLFILSHLLTSGWLFGAKALLNILVAVFVVIQIEIVFYVLDKDITREESRTLIDKSYPLYTALTFVLLMPVITPTYVIALGALLATFLGKLLFGGHTHSIFAPALVGYVMMTNGFQALTTGDSLPNTFDNFLLKLVFDNDFFNNTINLSNLFSVSDIMDGLIFNLVLFIAILFGVLIYKKAIQYWVTVVLVITFILISFLFNLNGFDLAVFASDILSSSIWFVAVFIATDVVVMPMNNKGRLLFAFIAGSIGAVMNSSGKVDGVIYGLLFANMIAPMINIYIPFEASKKVVKKVTE